MVVKVARAEVLRSLGNDLRTLHRLSIPERGAVLQREKI